MKSPTPQVLDDLRNFGVSFEVTDENGTQRIDPKDIFITPQGGG